MTSPSPVREIARNTFWTDYKGGPSTCRPLWIFQGPHRPSSRKKLRGYSSPSQPTYHPGRRILGRIIRQKVTGTAGSNSVCLTLDSGISASLLLPLQVLLHIEYIPPIFNYNSGIVSGAVFSKKTAFTIAFQVCRDKKQARRIKPPSLFVVVHAAYRMPTPLVDHSAPRAPYSAQSVASAPVMRAAPTTPEAVRSSRSSVPSPL